MALLLLPLPLSRQSCRGGRRGGGDPPFPSFLSSNRNPGGGAAALWLPSSPSLVFSLPQPCTGSAKGGARPSPPSRPFLASKGAQGGWLPSLPLLLSLFACPNNGGGGLPYRGKKGGSLALSFSSKGCREAAKEGGEEYPPSPSSSSPGQPRKHSKGGVEAPPISSRNKGTRTEPRGR